MVYEPMLRHLMSVCVTCTYKKCVHSQSGNHKHVKPFLYVQNEGHLGFTHQCTKHAHIPVINYGKYSLNVHNLFCNDDTVTYFETKCFVLSVKRKA